MKESHMNASENARLPPHGVSFSLPQILDSSGISEQNSSSPTTNAAKPPCGEAHASQLPRQPPLVSGSGLSALQLAPPHDDGTQVMSGRSANRSATQLPNRPASLPQLASPATTTTVTPGATPLMRSPAEGGTSPSEQPPSVPPQPLSSQASESPSTPQDGRSLAAWHHALVAFDKLFCICFVPPHVRPTLKVGELVLCEFGLSDNIGTVIADASPLVADVVAAKTAAANASAAALDAVFAPMVQRVGGAATPTSGLPSAAFVGSTPLYDEKPVSGLAGDRQPRRLPCVQRRGTNRDKKRVYFSRLRSNDALSAVQRMLLHKPVIAQAAEYQVNFACAIIYLAGDRSECVYAPQQFAELASTLVDPLRCETVEFRFMSEHHHGELDLTRDIIGPQFSELLHNCVVEHMRNQGGRAGAAAQRSTMQASAVKQQTPTTAHLQPQQQQQMPFMLYPAIATAASGGVPPPGIPSYHDAQGWGARPANLPAMTTVPTMAILQQPQQAQQPPSINYTLGPSIYVGQATQQPLSFMAPSPYQTLQQVSAGPMTYLPNPPPAAYYESMPQPLQQAQQQQPQQQQQLYYVLPWDQAQQQQHFVQQAPASQPSTPGNQQPLTLLRTTGGSTPPQPLTQSPGTYRHTPPASTLSYQAVSYPYVLPPSSNNNSNSDSSAAYRPY